MDLPRIAGGPDASGERPRALFAQQYGDGPLPEELVANVTRHICGTDRPSECATWLARWRADHPESAEARAYDPRTIEYQAKAEALAPANIDGLERIFRRALPPDSSGRSPVARAVAFTRVFTTYYVYAIPFDRSLLRTVWGGCDGGEASACQLARVQANERFERFELPRQDRGGS